MIVSCLVQLHFSPCLHACAIFFLLCFHMSWLLSFSPFACTLLPEIRWGCMIVFLLLQLIVPPYFLHSWALFFLLCLQSAIALIPEIEVRMHDCFSLVAVDFFILHSCLCNFFFLCFTQVGCCHFPPWTCTLFLEFSEDAWLFSTCCGGFFHTFFMLKHHFSFFACKVP